MRRIVLLTFAALALMTRAAQGQACFGFGSFANGMVGIGANVSGSPGVTSAGANLNLGKPSGVFGGAQIGLQEVNISSNPSSDFLVTSMRMGASVGYEISMGKANQISICPRGSVGHRFGPNYTYGFANIRQSGNDFAGEIAFGGVIKLGAKADLAPSVSVAYAGWTYNSTVVGGESASGNGSAFDATFSAGVVIAKRFAIRPFVTVSTQENSDPSIGLSFRVQLGQRR